MFGMELLNCAKLATADALGNTANLARQELRMRIVDRFLGRFKATQRNDSVFGPMRYMGDRMGYWESKISFAPTRSAIELFVDGSADNDMGLQHKFFDQLLQEWSAVSEATGKMLLQKWRDQESNTRAESLWEVFKLSSVSIPTASIEDAKWEISFATLAAPHQLWTIQMEGRKPRQLTVDD